MLEAQTDLLTSLLRDVSRSFYLTLRALPKAIRPQIGLAYLLARATDTIADTDVIPVSERLEALAQLRARILGVSRTRLDFSRFRSRAQGTEGPTAQPEKSSEPRATEPSKMRAERLLLERIEEALGVLSNCRGDDQARIREVLATITSGQELDLRRFGTGSASGLAASNIVTALETDAELEDYAYRVAGCVGEFWTKMCRAHLFPSANLDDRALFRNAVCFGKGLQLVNILRDLAADLKLGRCYVPAQKLAETGLQPADLLAPENEPRFRPLYSAYLDRAEKYLDAGWTYTNTLPYACLRVRLACAWPLLIGVKTLGKLRSTEVLQPAAPVKITRREVRNLLASSVLLYPWPRLWRGLLENAKAPSAKPIASKASLE